MALQKQPVAINFSKGLDTKTDPFQLNVGNFLTLSNSVFTTAGRLTKRNGFINITNLPNTDQTTLTTLNDSLVATGSNLYTYSVDTNEWINQGTIQPVQLSVQPLIRSSTSQTSQDSVVAPNGLVCFTYMDNSVAYYHVSDSNTGQQIVKRTALPSTAVDPRAFILGVYFIITFKVTITGVVHLQYIALPLLDPGMTGIAADISSSVGDIASGYDAYVFENNMYVAWEGGGSTVKIAFLTSSLVVSPVTTIAASAADLMTVYADPSNLRIWIAFWDSSANNGYSAAFDITLTQVMAKTQIITSTVINELTSVCLSGIQYVFYQNTNNYSYQDLSSDDIRSDFISEVTVALPGSGTGTGTASAPSVVVRSVGLASKAFIDNGVIYMMAVYGCESNVNSLDNSNQPSYFLIDSSGNVYMRLAYSNGGGYITTQILPNVSFQNNSYYISYLITDFLTTVNKGTNLPSGTPVNAIYTQTGVNLAKIGLNTTGQHSSEIAGALHLTGGQLWEYDGVKPVEHGFQVWPENVVVTTSGSGGLITAGTYFYVFTYEWTDNQGNLHRSAPSIPVSVVTSGSTSTNTINVPTLRLTYKISPNPVRIVGYRWSVAQQVYYQFTSVTSPQVNSTTTDSVTFTDTLSDSAILGQTLLYTTGGVIEDIAAPASIDSALFNNRLFLIDAEDRNLLWFSKQVIENVPVEMSDLLTLFIAPTTGAQGSTGPMTALSAMDDKLIIFKNNAIYYVNGTGPDNTGANSSFSDPVFITSSVGCSNPDSIVLMPMGIMFQSDKGIWLLSRNLETQYVGAPIEIYNSLVVNNAESIPGTTQVRFQTNSNITLMYDYFYNQWGTHSNIGAISGTLYQGLMTYLNKYGQIMQETANYFKDGSVPVLMSFTTSWMNIAGLQGYERFYFANLLGVYFSPFKLDVQLAYDYNPSAIQNIPVLPENYVANWGGEAVWGSGPNWGGPGNVFSARIFPDKQKCQSFQVSVQEVYDPSLDQPAGQGLSLSGLALIIGVKKGYRTQSAAKSFGGN